MKTKLLYLFLFILMSAGTATATEIAVVVNRENSVQNLTCREVSDIYLGRCRTFPSGDFALVLEHQRYRKLRKNFYRLLNGMSLSRLNAYWARLQFSGEVQPPPALPNSTSVIEAVRDNPDAIGYVDAQSVDDSVQVVLYLKSKKKLKKMLRK